MTPREAFVREEDRPRAYYDGPIPIGFGQTISQPYIVALMTELAEVDPADRVLEIGTGCGYQTAILSRLAGEVYSVERVPELLEGARGRLRDLGLVNVHFRHGDGWEGWPEFGPYSVILVAAAASEVPQRLVEQLEEGGRMILPVGGEEGQRLKVLVKQGGQVVEKNSISVRFVPLVKDENSVRTE